MSGTATHVALPLRRTDLVISRTGDDGEHVIKDPVSHQYFKLGAQESFLLLRLEGNQTTDMLRGAFEREFGEELTDEELDDFLQLAGEHQLLQTPNASQEPVQEISHPAPRTQSAPHQPSLSSPPAKPQQSILYWRQKIFNPDRLFDVLEPALRFFWTRSFLILSATAIAAAMVIAWANRYELVTRIPNVWRWDIILLAWLTLVVATTCHEFAHGLTCKHYGGHVHEVGFFLVFFTPCFYCNVSDAWLIPQKSRRMWVTFAGGYWDLIMWAASVFVWRLTLQDTLINYVAWLALTICGTRTFFNFNPLIKLDGYYLLSDALHIPNLNQRGWESVAARLRWLLWGAPRPAHQERGRLLLAYGLMSWVYSLFFLSLMLFGFVHYFGTKWGIVGFAGATIFGILVFRGLLQGISGGEVSQMIRTRRLRTAAWLFALAGTGAAMAFVQIDRKVSGQFRVRPLSQAELASPVAGFLRDIKVDEGDHVHAGDVIALLEIPDLETRKSHNQDEQTALDAKIIRCRGDVEAAKLQCLHKFESQSQEDEAHNRLSACQAELAEAQTRLSHCHDEANYLNELTRKSVVRSPISGVISTPHLKEKTGHYCHEGDLICNVEDLSTMVAECKLAEQDVADVHAGQPVELKARALPFQVFHGSVERIAPAANPGDLQSTVTVYCRISASRDFRPAMTGQARIKCGRASLGSVIAEKTLRFVRTEFWL